MPAHDAAGRGRPPGAAPPDAARARPGAVVAAGAQAAVAGWAALVAAVALLGEVANEPTAVAGIDSSTWTAITGVTGLFWGADAVHGSFAIWSILFGLAALLVYAVVLGIGGVALLVYTQGLRPGAFGAALHGFTYGLFAQVFVVNLIVNSVQSTETVYASIPQWGWWLAHGAYGVALGVAAAALLPRRDAVRHGAVA